MQRAAYGREYDMDSTNVRAVTYSSNNSYSTNYTGCMTLYKIVCKTHQQLTKELFDGIPDSWRFSDIDPAEQMRHKPKDQNQLQPSFKRSKALILLPLYRHISLKVGSMGLRF
jgi:hypothetical protein